MQSFADRVRARVQGEKPKTIQENLITGMYVVMRKLKGYTHFDFLRDDFMASQYFLLIETIKQEQDEQAKEEKKMRDKSKRK